MSAYNIIINLAAIVVGLILLYYNRKASHSLIGSFFKRYYDFSMTAIILLIVSFLTEFFFIFGANNDVDETVHNILLIIAGVAFVFTSISLPKEASVYMQSMEAKKAEEEAGGK